MQASPGAACTSLPALCPAARPHATEREPLGKSQSPQHGAIVARNRQPPPAQHNRNGSLTQRVSYTAYDANGAAIAVSETFRTSKNRTFVNDAAGRILQKTENGKTQNYFYANDKPVGSSGALSAN